MDETTEEICVVVFADPSDFANDTLEDVFSNVGISTISVLITPTADGSATGKIFYLCLNINLHHKYAVDFLHQSLLHNASFSPATDDFNAEPLTVNLDSTQLRDCVQIPIVEDALLDPNEMFSVVLTTNTPGVVVRSGRDSAQVIIDPRKLIMYSSNTRIMLVVLCGS